MKKMFLLLASILLLTGCGEKKLTCTKTAESEGLKMNEEIILYYKEDKISGGSFTAELEVPEEYIEYIGDLKSEMEEEYEDIKNIADLTIDSKDNKVKVNISYKTKGLTEDELDELYYGGLYAEVNLEETKKEYEENEYTCK